MSSSSSEKEDAKKVIKAPVGARAKELNGAELAASTDQPMHLVTRALCSNWGLVSIGDLSEFRSLARLDISRNHLRQLDGVQPCKSLTWLGAAHNELTGLEPLYSVTTLRVLNVAHNQLGSLVPCHRLTELQALVANNNQLTSIKVLRGLSKLNSLVLSHNRLADVRELPKLAGLRKLNLAYNELTTFPDVGALYHLQELRLGHNRIGSVPDVLAALTHLKIVDLGHNLLHEWRSVTALARIPALKSLTLAGNPLASAEDYIARVVAAAPSLKILDTRQLSEEKNKLKDRVESWKRRKDPEYAMSRRLEQAKAPSSTKKRKEPPAAASTEKSPRPPPRDAKRPKHSEADLASTLSNPFDRASLLPSKKTKEPKPEVPSDDSEEEVSALRRTPAVAAEKSEQIVQSMSGVQTTRKSAEAKGTRNFDWGQLQQGPTDTW